MENTFLKACEPSDIMIHSDIAVKGMMFKDEKLKKILLKHKFKISSSPDKTINKRIVISRG